MAVGAGRARPASARPAPAIPFGPAVALVALAALAGQWRALTAPFFADDWLFLDQVRQRSILSVLGSPDPLGNYFRPLGRQVWFSALSAWGGESPVVFHAANLLLLVLALVLLARITRRVAGPAAGVIAAAFVALHYAVDVPVLWASGSQELLALVLVLAALDRQQQGARWAGAGLFLMALFAKESVMLAPVVAIALDRAEGQWRTRVQRAAPWLLAVLVWVVIAVVAARARGTWGAGLQLTPLGPLAAPVLLVRVVLGLEWVRGSLPWSHALEPGLGGSCALLLAVAGVSWIGRATRVPSGKGATAQPAWAAGPALRIGLVWALAGAIPVGAVAAQWSAYYFLFALAGAGLALGALLSTCPPIVPASVVLLLGLASQGARSLDQFATAPSAWSGQSHTNRFYLERGMEVTSRCIDDLRRQMPVPPTRTTVFMAGLPSFAAVQVADGPLLRAVYRDSTLRGYFLSQLSLERLARGPWRVFFYQAATGRLLEETDRPVVLLRTALGMVLNGQPDVALAALEAAAAEGPPDAARDYVRAWVTWEHGDRARAIEQLQAAGRAAGRDGARNLAEARQHLASHDTTAAIGAVRTGLMTDALDADLHALASDLLWRRTDTHEEGLFEAYVTRLLDPDSPLAWRRWAVVLAEKARTEPALAALDRYASLDPRGAEADLVARTLRARLLMRQPGGEFAQQDLKRELQHPR